MSRSSLWHSEHGAPGASTTRSSISRCHGFSKRLTWNGCRNAPLSSPPVPPQILTEIVEMAVPQRTAEQMDYRRPRAASPGARRCHVASNIERSRRSSDHEQMAEVAKVIPQESSFQDAIFPFLRGRRSRRWRTSFLRRAFNAP